MEVVYNVKNKYKTNEFSITDDMKKIINIKLINVIMKLEKQKYLLNN